MNKILFIALFSIISLSTYAQKCSYEKDKIDENTQLVIRRTTPITLCKVNGHPFIFKSQQIGERKYLKLRYYIYNNFSIIEGSKFIFYFENGNKLMIDPLEIKKKPNTNQNGIATVSSMIVYQLDNDNFKAKLVNLINLYKPNAKYLAPIYQILKLKKIFYFLLNINLDKVKYKLVN